MKTKRMKEKNKKKGKMQPTEVNDGLDENDASSSDSNEDDYLGPLYQNQLDDNEVFFKYVIDGLTSDSQSE